MISSENRLPLFRIMLQLSRGLPQVGIDACLPSAAGLAIGREDVVIKTKLHRLLWIFQGRSATPDDSVAVADFRAIQHLLRQLGSLVIFCLGDAMGINLG